MMTYRIALFLFVIGAVGGFINSCGIFDASVPLSSYNTFTEASVTEITEGISTAEWNPLGGLSSLGVLIGTLGTALLTPLTYAPLLISWGCPSEFAIVLNLPVWFVYAFDIANWVGNRPPNR